MMDDITIEAAETAWMINDDGEKLLVMKVFGEIYSVKWENDVVEKLGKEKLAKLMCFLIVTYKIDVDYTVRDLEAIWDDNSEIISTMFN